MSMETALEAAEAFGLRIAIVAPRRADGERDNECKPPNHLKHNAAVDFVDGEPLAANKEMMSGLYSSESIGNQSLLW